MGKGSPGEGSTPAGTNQPSRVAGRPLDDGCAPLFSLSPSVQPGGQPVSYLSWGPVPLEIVHLEMGQSPWKWTVHLQMGSPPGDWHLRDGLNHVHAHLHAAVGVVGPRFRQPRDTVITIPQDLNT